MKIVKIDVQVKDTKYGDGHYTLSAISVEAAVKYLKGKFKGIIDTTEQYFNDHPYQMENEDKLLKQFTHTKERVDEDGGWDYPRVSEFSLYWEEVIE